MAKAKKSKQPIPAKKTPVKKPTAKAKKTPAKAKAATPAVTHPMPVEQLSLNMPPSDGKARKKVLHVGCGQATKMQMHKMFHGDEWQEVRFDITESVKPDIIGDMRNMPQVPTGSMDALYSSHNLEHVYAHEVRGVLKEFIRVLKPGGLLVLTLPDIQAVAFRVAQGKLEEPLYQSASGPISAMDVMFGFGSSLKDGHFYMAHKTAFTAHSLAKHLLAVGFHNVEVTRETVGMNLWAVGQKPGGALKNSKHQANVKGNYLHSVVELPAPGTKPDDLDTPPRLPVKLGR